MKHNPYSRLTAGEICRLHNQRANRRRAFIDGAAIVLMLAVSMLVLVACLSFLR